LYNVYLSPSTQESNIGVGGYGTEEDRMHQIADVIKVILEKHGITVYKGNKEQSLQQMVTESNKIVPNLHLAIHSDAFNPEARGATVYYNGLYIRSMTFAETIYKYIEPLTPAKDRGCKVGNNFYEIKNIKATVSLVEVSFHTNKDDAEFIINNIYEIGLALAKGVLDYLRVNYKESVEETIVVRKNYINVKINGRPVSVDNILYDGRTYLKLRDICDLMGKKLEWNEETKTANIVG
jgi:N-acetylmuramoyl-L-alanine amidase